MAYVDPGTFASSGVLTAAEMNVVGDDLRYLKAMSDGTLFAGVSLLRTTTQSIPDSTYTDVSWSSSPIDVAGWWTSGATVTVPSAVIPPGYTTAYLEVNATARFNANGTGSRGIVVLQNGGTVEAASFTSGLPSDTTPVAITVWIAAAAADAIRVQVYQSSGAALLVNQCSLHLKRIGFA